MRISPFVLMGLSPFGAVSGIAQDRVELVDPYEVVVSNPAPLTEKSALKMVLYDNGPLVNCPGCGVGGADESRVQTSLSMNILGFGHQWSLGNSLADDFTVPGPDGWQIDRVMCDTAMTRSAACMPCFSMLNTSSFG